MTRLKSRKGWQQHGQRMVLTVRMDADLHAALTDRAIDETQRSPDTIYSMNDICIEAIRQYLAAKV